MVRQRQKKSLEELYATKFEAAPNKSQVNTINNNNNTTILKNSRTDRDRERDRDFGGYILTSNTPYNSNAGASSAPQTSGISNMTSRRKSARPTPHVTKPPPNFAKEDKLHSLEEAKKDNSKLKTARIEKCTYNNAHIYDNNNKNYANFVDNVQKDMNMHHHHHHQSTCRDDDKDDDTEEFFELIRQTVENAIGKSISDLLNRNFRELSAKVDRFSAELKSTNQILNKLQTEMTNKVVHYGEENSRHFRYLCMKSEYDKMFYQHQTMLAGGTTATTAPPPMDKRATAVPKTMSSQMENEKQQNPCTCRTNKKLCTSEPHKTSSDEHSMSNKSSEIGMREVLEHIQRFCTQMQLNDSKCDETIRKSSNFRLEDAMKINKEVFEEDDDDFQMSSDGMTPRSDEHIHKYGGTTMRSNNATHSANNGGGDA